MTDAFAPLDLDRLRRATPPESVRDLGPVDSTNTALLASLTAEPPPPLPALFLSELQTAGRGRGGNRWIANPGDLTFSLALPKDRVMVADGLLAIAAAIAICDAIAEQGLRFAMVKWPNDVVVVRGGRLLKLAGILIERTPDACVVGIGLNVAPRRQPGRTTLCDELADRTLSQIDRTAVLASIVRRLSAPPTADELRLRFSNRDALRGRRIAIQETRGESVGIAAGIAADGELLLADGRRIRSATVRLAD